MRANAIEKVKYSKYLHHVSSSLAFPKATIKTPKEEQDTLIHCNVYVVLRWEVSEGCLLTHGDISGSHKLNQLIVNLLLLRNSTPSVSHYFSLIHPLSHSTSQTFINYWAIRFERSVRNEVWLW